MSERDPFANQEYVRGLLDQKPTPIWLPPNDIQSAENYQQVKPLVFIDRCIVTDLWPYGVDAWRLEVTSQREEKPLRKYIVMTHHPNYIGIFLGGVVSTDQVVIVVQIGETPRMAEITSYYLSGMPNTGQLNTIDGAPNRLFFHFLTGVS